MKLKICVIKTSKVDSNLKEALCKLLHVFFQLSNIFDMKYHFIEIDDYGVIFSQKLANHYHVISAIRAGEVAASCAEIEQT